MPARRQQRRDAARWSACLHENDWYKAWAHDGADCRADLLRPIWRVAREQVPGAIRELLGVFVGLAGQLSFGGFTLDVESRQLHRGTDAQAVHLSPKGFELLRILIEARPRAIAKRELHERLWPDTFVSEATLSSLVAEVREALGERGRQAQFIRTLHGYGYSFAADAAPSASGVGAISNWVVCAGREIALADGEHILGRDADAKVELRSPAVSRHHARIVISGTSATLEDLGSKNGTTVRGQAVTAPVQLADGDEIRIGSFVLSYRTVSAKGSTKSAAGA